MPPSSHNKPEKFGSYMLVERIGFGGMADVHRAERHGEGGFVKVVAIKRILPHLADNEDFLTMFIDEARIAASLDHANIVSIHDFGRIDGQLYLVMEMVEGKSLAAILTSLRQQQRPMPLRHVLFIVLELCKGLRAAHTRRVDGVSAPVVHRDVSPPNVLCSFGGEVKLTDFGVAKAGESLAVTEANTLKGKLPYMSPEQVEGRPVDTRSDVFSLGVVLHEMLTGQRLFDGKSQGEVLLQVLQKDLVAPSQHRPTLPAEIDRFTLKALARRPEDRYQSIAELGQHVSRFLLTSRLEASTLGMADFLGDLFPADLETRRSADGAFEELDQPAGTLQNLVVNIDQAGTGAGLQALLQAHTDRSESEAAPVPVGEAPDVAAPAPQMSALTEIKSLASQVQTRVDAGIWVQLALLVKLSTETHPDQREKIVHGLLEAASGVFGVPAGQLKT